MKAVWKGSIAFGLVEIPVAVYPASEPRLIQFHLMHKKCGSRLRYRRWCDKDKMEVPWDQTVRGFELAKGRYFMLTTEEMGKLKPKKAYTIDIEGFVESSQVDKIYLDKKYFVLPSRENEKAYFLLKEALIETGKAAFGSFIMHEREHICLIESYKSGFLLTTLNYAYETRDIEKVSILRSKPKLAKEEIAIANQMIRKKTIKALDMDKYRETFALQLKELIKRKMAGKELAIATRKQEKMTLMEALKASVK